MTKLHFKTFIIAAMAMHASCALGSAFSLDDPAVGEVVSNIGEYESYVEQFKRKLRENSKSVSVVDMKDFFYNATAPEVMEALEEIENICTAASLDSKKYSGLSILKGVADFNARVSKLSLVEQLRDIVTYRQYPFASWVKLLSENEHDAPDLLKVFKKNGIGMEWACQQGVTPLVSFFIQNGVHIDTRFNGKSLLMVALMHDNIKTAEFLIQSGASVDAIDGDGKTALIYALNKGYLRTAEFLIQFGASVDAQTAVVGKLHRNYVSALHKDCIKTKDLLIRAGVNADTIAQALLMEEKGPRITINVYDYRDHLESVMLLSTLFPQDYKLPVAQALLTIAQNCKADEHSRIDAASALVEFEEVHEGAIAALLEIASDELLDDLCRAKAVKTLAQFGQEYQLQAITILQSMNQTDYVTQALEGFGVEH